MNSEEMRSKAIDLFLKRFHWSQAILAVGQEKMNIVDESAVKTVGAFGGGIASTGNVCGILLGGVALISSIYSRGNMNEKEHPRMWALSKKFVAQFEELAQPYGGTHCLDIAGVDWRDKKAVKEYYSNPDSTRKACIQLLGEAAYLLGELLEHEGAKQRG